MPTACWLASDERVIIAGPYIYVRGHVNQMAGAGSETGEPLGTGHGLLGMLGCLDGVYIKMISADVVRVALQHAFEHIDYLARAFCRLAIVAPKLPGMHVHGGVGEQDGGVRIGRILPHHLAHGLSIIDVELLRIGLGIGGIALGESADEGLFSPVWRCLPARRAF